MAENIRERILSEALLEINLHGVGFHMDDLAKRLRISKRTLYEHFSSKQEIVEQALAVFMNRIYTYHQKIVHDSQLNAEQKLIAYFDISDKQLDILSVRKVNELIAKMPAICERVNSRYESDWQLLDQVLKEAQDSGEFKPFDRYLVLRILRSAADGIADYVSDVNRDCKFSDYMAHCVAILLYGLKSEKNKDNS